MERPITAPARCAMKYSSAVWKHAASPLLFIVLGSLKEILMKVAAIAILGLCAAGPALAQQPASQQQEADKGIKTQNSGASGYVGEQDKPGSAAQAPGQSGQANTTGGLANSPSAQNSGAGIAGAAGSKNGPAADKNTVGSSSPNVSTKDQDPANVKGLPGNKSGPPAKR
jgi:hypothetical protein